MPIDNLIINNPFAVLLPETLKIDNDIIKTVSPTGLHHLYKLGLINGVLIDTDKTPYPYRDFARYNFQYLADNQEDNQSIIFEDTKYYGKIKGSGQGKRRCNHHNYLRIDPVKAGKGAQNTGDCVSWAIRNALDELRCLRIAKLGLFEAYITRQATCGIYSGRGHTGQGADPVALSAWAVKIGTLLERIYETVKEKYDFTNYDNYVRWGMSRGRIGMPDDLLELTNSYKAGTYKVVATTEALRDLIFNDGTAHCGSDLAVETYGNPISKRRGTWSHDMAIPMYDDTKEFFDFCVWGFDQSWGSGFNRVENIPEPWKPITEGMFFINDKDMQWAINDGGTVVFFDGSFFNAEPLENRII